jgi:hypothetical protein
MKRISQIFLFGAVTVTLLAAACAPVEGVPTLPGALQENLTGSPTALATDTTTTADPSQATATNTTQTSSIPVTGLEVILLNCPYCVDNVAHDQLLIPREATFRVTSPPELVRNDDDDDDGEGGRRRTAQLSGAAEVPGPGDPDGSGTATIRLQLEQGEVCFDLTVSNIGSATAAHIHEGAEGVAGPVVVPLDPAPTGGSSSGCISNIDAALIQNIAQNPEQYYVNVHNEEFPDGAIRGQLGRVDDDDNGNNDNDDDDNGDNEDDEGEDDDEDDDDNGDRLGCRVIDRFRDKKLVLCRAEENTTITMNVCLDDNTCTEVQITLQSCALATGTPTATSTVVTTTTPATETPTPIGITATATSTSTTATATSTPVAPATGTPTPTVVTNTPIASATNTATPTSTATSTPTP